MLPGPQRQEEAFVQYRTRQRDQSTISPLTYYISQPRPCTRAGFISDRIITTHRGQAPVTPTYYSPTYSNIAFQLLAYTVDSENITGLLARPQQHHQSPDLTHTFLSPPLNDTDAVVVDGFARDLGDAAP
ncbi:hypothetical protein QBC37DRAFT_378879 [Rhypophila decipiens]|uniref:Uncharacterized protein n=1 Tax=Rhypophila decipiens TaxID=261697 RepID=A0AAN6Y3G1_9PEZI|nr:hypothetical protein QBC37DRAFT_378879 [Rhypophila decipiens]